MKKLLVSTALLAVSGLALAHGCPGEMKKIDSAMPTT